MRVEKSVDKRFLGTHVIYQSSSHHHAGMFSIYVLKIYDIVCFQADWLLLQRPMFFSHISTLPNIVGNSRGSLLINHCWLSYLILWQSNLYSQVYIIIKVEPQTVDQSMIFNNDSLLTIWSDHQLIIKVGAIANFWINSNQWYLFTIWSRIWSSRLRLGLFFWSLFTM